MFLPRYGFLAFGAHKALGFRAFQLRVFGCRVLGFHGCSVFSWMGRREGEGFQWCRALGAVEGLLYGPLAFRDLLFGSGVLGPF